MSLYMYLLLYQKPGFESTHPQTFYMVTVFTCTKCTCTLYMYKYLALGEQFSEVSKIEMLQRITKFEKSQN